MGAGRKCPSCTRNFMWYLSDLCHGMRESQGKMLPYVRESQGTQSQLTASNPITSIKTTQETLRRNNFLVTRLRKMKILSFDVFHIQAQLRAFIPEMLKYSTGRSKPGWGKPECRPVWWPNDVPWANVRSDVRSEEEKKKVRNSTNYRACRIYGD